MVERNQNTTGLQSNVGGLLAYLAGWITGLIFYLLEEKDEFIRFHAMQSIVTFGFLTVVHIFLGFLQWIPYIWVLFLIIQILVGIFTFVLWIVLMVKAYQSQRFKLPVAGDLAERYSAPRPH